MAEQSSNNKEREILFDEESNIRCKFSESHFNESATLIYNKFNPISKIINVGRFHYLYFQTRIYTINNIK
jgi:hypothetical protein